MKYEPIPMTRATSIKTIRVRGIELFDIGRQKHLMSAYMRQNTKRLSTYHMCAISSFPDMTEMMTPMNNKGMPNRISFFFKKVDAPCLS